MVSKPTKKVDKVEKADKPVKAEKPEVDKLETNPVEANEPYPSKED